jgi:16S rRNA (cytidine1402-2'-O)-methyltransferase
VDAAPGASAPLTALVLSGFAPYEFTFAGFPPRKKKELKEWFSKLLPEMQRRPLVLLEAPHRLEDTLETALETLGDMPVAVCRELTKLHQEVRREKLSEALAHFHENRPRGEFTLVFGILEETASTEQENASQDEEVLLERLRRLKAEGLRAKEAVELVMQESGLPRRQIYDLWLKLSH